MIDYQEIIDNLDDEKIITLMTSLGVEHYIEKDNYIQFPTICHNENADEASMKLYYYKDNHFFYCFTECGGLSIFNLLKKYYETRGIDYNWYIDILEPVLNCSIGFNSFEDNFCRYKSVLDKYETNNELKELPTYSEGILDMFIKYYPIEWLQDNITKETMDKFNIKYSISQNKIIIPHYNTNNELVGIRGRALEDWEIENVGKYIPIKIEKTWYTHPLSLNLYGLNVNKENIKKMGICFLSEGEKSVLQAENFQMPNCTVATCGSNLNKFQIKLLLKECSPQEIIVCYDNEEIGNDTKYFDKLYKMCSKYKKDCNISFVYDRNHLLKLKESPFDKGEKIFNELIKTRVRV